MARLFITPREIDFISDITKEITKDVIGQVIYYYKPRIDLSKIHDLYSEATERVFDPPVEIDCRISWGGSDLKLDRFGQDKIRSAEVYLHYRDLIDRNIKVEEGDYFQFGDTFYEMLNVSKDKIMFGQVEHITGYNITAKQVRKGIIDKPAFGPTEEKYLDDNAVQEVFTQQRGDSNKGDKRSLVNDEVLDSPIAAGQTVQPASSSKSSFYGDDS
tara:strand:+ start:3225 stop:3869 length:645 start_codon:yes stop_codon:yes gene_type:complete